MANKCFIKSTLNIRIQTRDSMSTVPMLYHPPHSSLFLTTTNINWKMSLSLAKQQQMKLEPYWREQRELPRHKESGFNDK